MKNGFINAPFGTVVVWLVSNTCPPGFVRASEITTDAVYMRNASTVNISATSATAHQHYQDAGAHTHNSSHYHTGNLYGGITATVAMIANQVHAGHSYSDGAHYHAITTHDNYWNLTPTMSSDRSLLDAQAYEPPYYDALLCRRA